MRSGTFWLRYRTPSGSGKYIEFGLSVKTGAERIIIIVDIFDITQPVRDIGIQHLKDLVLIDEEPKSSRGPQRRSERQMGGGSLKKYLNAPRPSEHLPVRGENVKTFRRDHRLQIQNLFMVFQRVPLWS